MMYANYVKENSIQSSTFFKWSHVAINEVFDWWSQVTGENIHLPDATLLYGPTNSFKHHQPLSFAGGKVLSLQNFTFPTV